jgi:hypothetical protein
MFLTPDSYGTHGTVATVALCAAVATARTLATEHVAARMRRAVMELSLRGVRA